MEKEESRYEEQCEYEEDMKNIDEDRETSAPILSRGGITDSEIIGIQKTNGTWLLEEIVATLAWNKNLIESKNPSSDITLWVTTLTLCYLEDNFSNTKDLWGMVAKKAKTYITKSCKKLNLDLENFMQQARQTLLEL